MARTSARAPGHTKSTESHAAGHNAPLARNRLSHEEIARRAYDIFVARGGQHGNHEEDWLQAERELKLGR
ncbi:DUF2934 domain-containing protein [Myxococcaceae bacterium GXIMD 01537]